MATNCVGSSPRACKDERGEKLNVGAQVAAGLCFGEHAQGGFFHVAREIVELAVFKLGFSELLGHVAQHFGARIANAIDAVAEIP